MTHLNRAGRRIFFFLGEEVVAGLIALEVVGAVIELSNVQEL